MPGRRRRFNTSRNEEINFGSWYMDMITNVTIIQ